VLIPTEAALIPAKAAISRSPWINYWIAARLCRKSLRR